MPSAIASSRVCRRQIFSTRPSEADGDVINCPLHHYRYNLPTGENTCPFPIYPAWKRAQVGDLSLPRFRVIERDGWIAVDPKPIRKQITDLRADA